MIIIVSPIGITGHSAISGSVEPQSPETKTTAKSDNVERELLSMICSSSGSFAGSNLGRPGHDRSPVVVVDRVTGRRIRTLSTLHKWNADSRDGRKSTGFNRPNRGAAAAPVWASGAAHVREYANYEVPCSRARHRKRVHVACGETPQRRADDFLKAYDSIVGGLYPVAAKPTGRLRPMLRNCTSGSNWGRAIDGWFTETLGSLNRSSPARRRDSSRHYRAAMHSVLSLPPSIPEQFPRSSRSA